MIKLDGVWKFRLDPKDKGFNEHWENEEFLETIQIPGVLQEQGYGEDISYETEWVEGLSDPLWYLREEYQYAQDEIRVPFLSQPPKIYRGKAWYQTTISKTQIKSGNWYSLFIENTRWRSHVWLDDKDVGEDFSLCTPHEFELGFLEEKDYKITICLDNSMQLPYRPDGHGVSDSLGAGWNGMVGRIEIHSHPALCISEVKVFSEIEEKIATFEVTLWNHRKETINATLGIKDGDEDVLIECEEGYHTITITKAYGEDAALWDEFSKCTRKEAIVVKSDYGTEERLITFGLVNAKTENGLFLINNRPTYFRGTHFGGDYPLSGYPDCSLSFWQKIMSTLREWGLNFMRFHSYCPPLAAFEAADIEGVYLQVECGMWNSFEVGDPMLEVAKNEAERILHYFGNHPSFIMLSPSNEPKGEWLEPLSQFVKYCKALDPRKLYTIQSGWPYPMKPSEITGTDYVYFHRSGYGLEPGGTIRNAVGWKGGDYRESLTGITYPVICHELGQWCSYPDFSIIEKFTGYLLPGNFEVFRESAREHGIDQFAKEFSYHSGKLQSLMYKEDIEANLRTPHIYGFELLDLHDYLGQGTALVGVLDAFWDEKGYITAKEWRRFCSRTVPLARIEKYVYEQGELCHFPVEVSHFGAKPLENAKITYRLMEITKDYAVGKSKDNKNIINSVNTIDGITGVLKSLDIPIGKNIEVGVISFIMPRKETHTVYELLVQIETMEGEIYDNSWKLWSYVMSPVKTQISSEICYTKDWEEAKFALLEGKKVFFNPSQDSLSYDCPRLKFKPVFWNAQMGPTWARGMGILCDDNHSIFSEFPTHSYADWQWENILDGTRGINISKFQDKLDPIVRVIDDWNRNYPLALIMEAKVLNGKLLMTSVDFEMKSDKITNKALFHSILHYMESSNFNPSVSISEEEWMSVYHENHTMEILDATVMLEEDTGHDISVICNGNAEDYMLWKGHPAHIKITMPKAHSFYGILYVPRQNHREHEGDIKNYRVEYKKNGSWEFLCDGELSSSFSPKTILFPVKVTTNEIRFTALSGFGGKHVTKWIIAEDGWHSSIGEYSDPYISIACLTLLCDEKLDKWKGIQKDKKIEAKSATTDIEN